MPADYKGRSSGRDKTSLSGFAWFMAGLCIGLFVALLAYLDGQPETSTGFGDAITKELEKIKNKTETSNKKSTDKSADKPTSKNEPKFNFYTILPELEVLIPDTEKQPPSSASSKKLQDDKHYVLQAGSFRNLNDANKLKASLALLGFEANIQHVSVKGEEWHRIRIGPYQNTAELYKNISLLRQHDISAMPVELKP